MFSNLMRQDSAVPRVLKPTHGTKKLMSGCINILTFFRVSKHESIPHLSASWVKNSAPLNLHLCLFHKQRLLRQMRPYFADTPPSSSPTFVANSLWTPLVLMADSVEAREAVIGHRAATQRLLSVAHCRNLPTCSRIVPPFLQLQSFEIVPVWIVGSSTMAAIAYIETEWKTGWKRDVIADEGQTSQHHLEEPPLLIFPCSVFRDFAFSTEIWVETWNVFAMVNVA